LEGSALTTVIAVLIIVALAVLAAVLSAASGATALIPPGRVHRLAEAERPHADALETLVAQRSRLRGSAALLAGLVYALSAVVGAWLLMRWAPDLPGLVAIPVGASVAVLLVFSLVQVLPRTFAVANPERVALDSAAPALAITRFVSPVARILGVPWQWAVGVATGEEQPSPWATGDEFWTASASDEEAERERTEQALLEAVSGFAEKIVREVMVPRTDMVALQDTASPSEAIALVKESGYSRLPVYHETLDDAQSVLYAKDLLAAIEEGAGARDLDIRAIARPAYYVPETKPVPELLREMRTRTHIAIVADEYGGTAGLVTIEDLLEEIVGEIFDEYDSEVALIEQVAEGRYHVDARLPVDDLNETFGTAIETDADSVGGLFTEVAGHIPERGEAVTVDGVRLTVADLEGNRIRQLLVETVGVAEEGEEDA
jgi:putative hemolysin